MGKFSKWIGGGLGWVLGGPIGAILGFAIGNYFDNQGQAEEYYRARVNSGQRGTRSGDFEVSLLILSAIVIKADGKVDQKELDYVRQQFVGMFGTQRANQSFKLFKNVIDKGDISTRQVAMQIQHHMDHPSRLQLIHYLYGIAKADGQVTDAEVQEIEKIGHYLNIHGRDLASIKAMFYEEADKWYKILEIEPTASNEDIKKAYRKMAMKYHPDKLQHLDEQLHDGAKDKFQQVQTAYEALSKERGM